MWGKLRLAGDFEMRSTRAVRRRLIIGVGVGLVVAVVGMGLYLRSREASRERAREARQARRAQQRSEREEAMSDYVQSLRTQTTGKMPAPLDALSLGLDETELLALRPRITPRIRQGPAQAGRWFEERLPDGGQALYGFDEATDRLAQMQLLSLTQPEGIDTHFRNLVSLYGPPTGAWHCPETSPAGVATRRFTWRINDVSIQDVWLVHPGGVSLTLYIAPTAVIAQSLRLSECRPVQSRDELLDIPVASPDQLRDPQ